LPLFGGVSNGRWRGALRELKSQCPLRFVEGSAFGKLFRGLIIQRTVGPVLVVIDPPVLDDPFSLGQCGEPVQIQAFLAETAIEAFDVSILGRLAGVDEIELHAVIIGPSIQSPAPELRAVINRQNIGISAFRLDDDSVAGQVRYHGLAKNEAQMFSLMALANLYLARRCLKEESA